MLVRKISRTLRIIAAFALVGVMLLSQTGSSFAETFQVHIDQVRLMPLEKQGTAIIVGNPSIADVSVQSGNLLVVTGKSFGNTNVIVLDSERKVILDTVISVTNDTLNVVSLYKGSMKQSYNCSDKCETILMIGDEAEYVKNVQKTTTDKAALVAGGGQQGQPGQ